MATDTAAARGVVRVTKPCPECGRGRSLFVPLRALEAFRGAPDDAPIACTQCDVSVRRGGRVAALCAGVIVATAGDVREPARDP